MSDLSLSRIPDNRRSDAGDARVALASAAAARGFDAFTRSASRAKSAVDAMASAAGAFRVPSSGQASSAGRGQGGPSAADLDKLAAQATALGDKIQAALTLGFSPIQQAVPRFETQLGRLGVVIAGVGEQMSRAFKNQDLEAGVNRAQKAIQSWAPYATRAADWVSSALANVKAQAAAVGPASSRAASAASTSFNVFRKSVAGAAAAFTPVSDSFVAFERLKGWLTGSGKAAKDTTRGIRELKAASAAVSAAPAQKLNATLAATPPLAHQASAAVKGFGSNVLFALGAFGAAYKVVDFFRSGIKEAVEFNEVMSRTKTVFGDSAGTITAEATRLAKYGIRTSEFVDAASKLGATFKGAGAATADAAQLGTTLSKITLDLVSFDGKLSNAEGFTAMQAALRGEYDPLERLGVYLTADAVKLEAMRMGLTKGAGALTEMAKRAGALSLITKQAGSLGALGDLERTSQSAANQFRAAGGGIGNFGMAIGQVLLPSVTSAVGAFNELLASVVEVFETRRDVVDGWAAKLKGALDLVGTVVRNFGTFWQIAQTHAEGFFANVLAILDTFPENFSRVTAYLGRNWWNLIQDFNSAFESFSANLLTNAANLGTALWDALQGKGFDFQFTPLLKGFQRTAEELPKLLEPAWVSVQGRIDDLVGGMAKAEAAAAENAAAAAKAPAAAKPKDAGFNDPKFAQAAEAGSQEAYAAIIKNRSEGRDNGVSALAKIARDQLAEQKKATAATLSLKDALSITTGLAIYSF